MCIRDRLTNWWRGHLGVVSTLGLMMAFWIVAALATDLADRLRPSVGGVGAELAPERFLELIAALRSIRT